MEFYSESNHPPMTYHRECSKTIPVYEEQINTKTLQKELKKVGETNIYEKIQESRDATDIQKIIERYQINIDEKIDIRDEILDYTGYPGDLIEAYKMTLNAEQIWDKEPASIKEKFGNNFVEYLAAANNGTLEKVYNEVQPQKLEKHKEEKEAKKVEKVQAQQQELLNNGGNNNE